MSVEDYLLSLSDRQWRHLLTSLSDLYKAGAVLPPKADWIKLRDSIGAKRRAAKHADKLAKAKAAKPERRAYMATYMRAYREKLSATS